LKGQKNSPNGDGTDAVNQPGLKDMTLKAIDVLHERSKGKGWFMMSEAASIDKVSPSASFKECIMGLRHYTDDACIGL
jgi:alkaline phosphatase